jgi:acetolactate synthase-1/2/3 large subunit
MKAVRAVLDYLMQGGVRYLFGIPAGSVNALYDELYDLPQMVPIVTKHEGAASYMAAAYAKATNQLAVCVASSGPGGTNLLSGAANAMREHLPVLFLTGAVPVPTVGLNASQELDAEPIYRSVTKYSVTVHRAEDLLSEVARAVEIAFSGVPGPVHVAMPIDVQLQDIAPLPLPPFPQRLPIAPDPTLIRQAADRIASRSSGILFVGQGARHAIPEIIELAERLNWPMVTTPQAKGYIPGDHPLAAGVYGFAGHDGASRLIHESGTDTILVIGSSLGETATNNWNSKLTHNRFLIQIDIDSSVFNRAYEVDLPIIGDANLALQFLNHELERLGFRRQPLQALQAASSTPNPATEYNTQHVLLALQQHLPRSTRYTIDIGEFMSYVIHYMRVMETDSFDINVHFGAMGSAIGSAVGYSLADPSRPTVCITGDGCFFMHGMEMLTAKEYRIPMLIVVMNNARLGMVHHGHALQYNRAHSRFAQQPVDIAGMARAMEIPSARVERLQDITRELLDDLHVPGPSILEIALVDNNVPPMGDRVKFLSSFGR